MTTPLTTDIGEEYLLDHYSSGATVTYLLYDDSTDDIQGTDDLSAISTEPSDGNYARQSDTVASAQLTGSGNGDFGFDNDNEVSFDVSNTTGTVDAVGYVVNFDSSVAGDGGTATDHLIGVDSLSQARDLSNYDSLSFAAGDLEHAISGT